MLILRMYIFQEKYIFKYTYVEITEFITNGIGILVYSTENFVLGTYSEFFLRSCQFEKKGVG